MNIKHYHELKSVSKKTRHTANNGRSGRKIRFVPTVGMNTNGRFLVVIPVVRRKEHFSSQLCYTIVQRERERTLCPFFATESHPTTMINNKVALITGGANGIGLGIATQLASEGYAVALTGRSAEERVKENIDRVKSFDAPVMYISGDVTSDASRKATLQKVDSEFGRLDVLINNAGVAPKVRMDILQTTEENFDYVLDINLKGAFFLSQLAANYMIEEVGKDVGIVPMIINVSSISAYASSTARGEYCISKAGIGMVTMLFADRLAEYGINVYEIRPGIIAAGMATNVKEKYDRLIFEEGILPFKRWGVPEDVGNAVSVLCSGKLAYSTGEVINIDGGFHIRRL